MMGTSLSPGKAPGIRPKVDQLEADLKERPFAKFRQRCEYLEAPAGLKVSKSTICRAIKHLGLETLKLGIVCTSRFDGISFSKNVIVAFL